MSTNKHSAENCDQAPPDCNICHKRHLTTLHIEQTLKPMANQASQTNGTSTACTQVCGEEETGRSCARIVLINASHRSNPTKKLTTYAVLDDQSTDVFISDALLNNLEVDAPEGRQDSPPTRRRNWTAHRSKRPSCFPADERYLR